MRDALVLKPGRERSVEQRHPWVFSGAVASIGSEVADGAVVRVVTHDGRFAAWGYVNRSSKIVARLLSWDAEEVVDAAFFRRAIERAASRRAERAATRVVNAESDGLPGLTVDRYGRHLVLASSTLGIDRHKSILLEALVETLAPLGIFERSDVDGRQKEGLSPVVGPAHGSEPPELIPVDEPGVGGAVRLLVDVRRGHKTGAYLDQADNRPRVAAYCRDAEVLNLFAYTGAFGIHAAKAGAAEVINVDGSAPALELGARIAAENGLTERVRWKRADVFKQVRSYRDAGRSFDVVIVDPPKLAFSAAQVDRAARAYKDLARLSLLLLRPGGILATFSCSGHVSRELFQKIAFSASLEARRDVQILERLGAAPDHPVRLSFPEGEYLKGLICRAE